MKKETEIKPKRPPRRNVVKEPTSTVIAPVVVPVEEPEKPEPIEPHVEEPARPKVIWLDVFKSFWKRYWWVVGAIVLGIVVVIVSTEVQKYRIKKGIKETKKTEVEIISEKDKLRQAEENLDARKREVDSSIFKKINELHALLEVHRLYEAKQNEIYQKERNDIQNRLNTDNDDSLRAIGERASKGH